MRLNIIILFSLISSVCAGSESKTCSAYDRISYGAKYKVITIQYKVSSDEECGENLVPNNIQCTAKLADPSILDSECYERVDKFPKMGTFARRSIEMVYSYRRNNEQRCSDLREKPYTEKAIECTVFTVK